MFEGVATDELLGQLAVHDFEDPVDVMGAADIDAIAAYDRVIRAAQARQAVRIAALDQQRREQMSLVEGDHSLSVIGEISMARNISPSAAGTQYGLAIGLARMPSTTRVFESGGISEQAARLVIRETSGLDHQQIACLDRRLGHRLKGLTPPKAANLARRLAIDIDANAAFERANHNRADRYLSVFNDADGIAVLHARGPAEQVHAIANSLDEIASTQRAGGDCRDRGQIMFDTLVQRATGLEHADGCSVEIGLLMNTTALLGTTETGSEEKPPPAAVIPGYGPIPPALALGLILTGKQQWIRRLFTDPATGALVDCDHRRRRFDGKLAKLITNRDMTCRQPGCDSKIRDLDHILAHSRGGGTVLDNGQGLCKRSHTIKHLPGWKIEVHDDVTVWQTPTGRRYTTATPPIIEYLGHNPGHLRQ